MRCPIVFLMLASVVFTPCACAVEPPPWTPPVSTWTAAEAEPWDPTQTSARLHVQITDRGQPVPARIIVTAADGSHADAVGNGLHTDGRFFADGAFTVTTVAGRTRVEIRCGPDYVPLSATLDLVAGRQVNASATMARWYSPHDDGWYDGDNHVHAQHDATAAVRTSLAYTALQGRANGLAYLTEAGSAATISYDDLGRLSTADFLLRIAGEIRPGPFLGHFNPPGITAAIPHGRSEELLRTILPHHQLAAEVRQLGGVMIQTHPTTPPHQLHWMGASMLMADAVLGTTPDALDQDHPATQALWFSALNLGNRIAASGSTDAALGRKNTPTPGDRRVYSHAAMFTYAAIIDGIRRGRTVATNGGPLFLTMTINERMPGDEVMIAATAQAQARLLVHALNPLKRVVLYVNGRERWSGDCAGQRGHLTFTTDVPLPPALDGWCVARAESQSGDWAMTSPVYLRSAAPPALPPASLTLVQISNASRYASLSADFFAHVICTVRPPEELRTVDLLRDGVVLRRFSASEADQEHEDRVPVTQGFGTYGPGWAWARRGTHTVHMQADWPVSETGWYHVQVGTSTGRTLVSDAIHFDAAEPASQQLGVARLSDGTTTLDWWGYGQEAPRANLPTGDHWWYPQRSWWRMVSTIADTTNELGGGDAAQRARFRSATAP